MKKMIWPGVSLLLLLALAASLFLNVRLYRYALGFYRQTNQVQLNPLNLERFVNDPIPPADQPLVIFFGDSRAADWPAPDLAAYHYANRAIWGDTTAQLRGRYDPHVRPHSPDILILQAGINDLKAIAVMPHNRANITATTIANLEAIVAAANQQGVVVILTTIFPTGRVPLDLRPIWSDEVDEAVLEVNEAIRGMARPQIILVDTYNLLTDETGATRREYYADMVHLNPAGYARLNEELIKLLPNRTNN